MSQTESQSAQMASTANEFDRINGSLQSMLSTLMRELEGLSAGWKGQGAMAFDGVKNRYASDLKRLNEALAETAAGIRSSGASYERSDTEAASSIGRTGGQFTLPL
ncbi:WXG100 family type VII secretion target [Actinoplanes sp. CA-252034]|uniref:WXG100 family type VII secretion target n=1 Tax=Actinoplanes sp. CA-252034 TaxID=3239906 RepID=UPI003D97D3E3